MSSTTIEAEEARLLLGRGEARALDLRSEQEMADGHAPGAIAAADDLDDAVDRALGGEQVRLVVFSADGERAAEVAAALHEQGHEAVAVEGGWERWLSEGLPVQPRPDQEFEGPDLLQPDVTAASKPTEGDDRERPPEDGEQKRGAQPR